MKVLIWISTFLLGAIVNTLIGVATGIKAGSVLLFIVEYFIAKKLCEKWDEKQAGKNTENKRCGNCGYNSFDSNGVCRNCGGKSKIEYDESVENVEGINDSTKNILKNQQTVTEKESDNLPYHDKTILKFCSKCGAKLIDDAEFCNKCGTKITEVK